MIPLFSERGDELLFRTWPVLPLLHPLAKQVPQMFFGYWNPVVMMAMVIQLHLLHEGYQQ